MDRYIGTDSEQQESWHYEGPDEGEYSPRSTIEIMHDFGTFGAWQKVLADRRLRQPARKAETSDDRQVARVKVGSLLTSLSALEADAGPTLQQHIIEAKSFQAAHGEQKLRTDAIRRCVGQRAGLLKLLQVEAHSDIDFEPTGRVLTYVHFMLALSANVAALSGSGWPSVAGWFEQRFQTLLFRMDETELEKTFDAFLMRANAKLAARPLIKGSDYLTGPTATDMAHELGVTIEQLRYAGANRCGLTSINPEPKRNRDRRQKAEKRRAAGMIPQSERTLTVERRTLADRSGKSVATIRRKEGTAQFWAELDVQGVRYDDLPAMSKKCRLSKEV